MFCHSLNQNAICLSTSPSCRRSFLSLIASYTALLNGCSIRTRFLPTMVFSLRLPDGLSSLWQAKDAAAIDVGGRADERRQWSTLTTSRGLQPGRRQWEECRPFVQRGAGASVCRASRQGGCCPRVSAEAGSAPPRELIPSPARRGMAKTLPESAGVTMAQLAGSVCVTGERVDTFPTGKAWKKLCLITWTFAERKANPFLASIKIASQTQEKWIELSPRERYFFWTLPRKIKSWDYHGIQWTLKIMTKNDDHMLKENECSFTSSTQSINETIR